MVEAVEVVEEMLEKASRQPGGAIKTRNSEPFFRGCHETLRNRYFCLFLVAESIGEALGFDVPTLPQYSSIVKLDCETITNRDTHMWISV